MTHAANGNNGTAIGIIGGTGLYSIEGLAGVRELHPETPFGPPSDAIVAGQLAGRDVFFLPRHGKGHRILPHELNHRANLYALRALGVRWLLSVSAVGSLQPQYAPRDILLPSQYFDRSSFRGDHTFFGGGIVAHVAFAEPLSARLRHLVWEEAVAAGYRCHNGGVYVQMDGPAFSTRAESELHRKMGFDVVGMTNLGEAKLAREAEIAMATLAMVTDYDCWKIGEEAVTAQAVIGHLQANAEAAKTILARVIPKIPETPDWPEHRALDDALVTPKALWPEETAAKLEAILGRFR